MAEVREFVPSPKLIEEAPVEPESFSTDLRTGTCIFAEPQTPLALDQLADLQEIGMVANVNILRKIFPTV